MPKTFEQTYPLHPFSELVRLGVALGETFARRRRPEPAPRPESEAEAVAAAPPARPANADSRKAAA